MANANNPFLTGSGVSGVPITKPAITGSGYAPAINRMAAKYAQPLADQVSSYMGGKGLTDSSMYGGLLTDAYGQGFDRAFGDYLSQQQIYNQWSRDMMAYKMQGEAAPEEGPWWQKAAPLALAGAGIGSEWGKKGAGWGAAIGALSSFLT